MTLFLDAGGHGHSARRDLDPPPTYHQLPDAIDSHWRGVLLACADGVADRPQPNDAARDALTALRASYYAAPETWSLEFALRESVQAAHQALRHAGERGRAAAISALVLHRRRWLLAHAGNARVWLYRQQQLRQLTRDHLTPRPVGPARVDCACGLTERFEPQIETGELHEGDIFLITTVALHDAVDGAHLLSVLHTDGTAQQLAEALTKVARDKGAGGGFSACVARIDKLPPASALDDDDGRTLPIMPLPDVGAVVDEFVIAKRLHRSQYYTLYRAQDRTTGEVVVLKLPQPGSRDPVEVARRFLREEWIIRRLQSPQLVALKPLSPGRRSALYSVMEMQTGENLAARIKRKRGLPLAEAQTIGVQLLEVLSLLHQQGIVHRDIRPSNLLYDKRSGQLKVLGLGGSSIEALHEPSAALAPTALSYAAPELLRGEPANERSDVYAVGVTLYRLISARFPYGKIAGAGDWPRHEYAPLARYNAEVSPQFDAVVQRACAPVAAERFASTKQFASALAAAPLTAQAMTETTAAATSTPAVRTIHRDDARLGPAWHWAMLLALVLGLISYLVVVVRVGAD